MMKALLAGPIVRRSRRRSALAVALVIFPAFGALALSPERARPHVEVMIAPSETGQFVATASVNGVPLVLVIDTGASKVVLSYEDAVRAGITPSSADFTQVAETANGVTRFAPVTLKAVTVGPVVRTGIPALVAEKGRLASSLLGMTFLSQLSSVGTRGGQLVLSN